MNQFTKLKFKDNDFEMDINLSTSDNSAWLNQKELAEFYNTTKKSISKYIAHIFNEELLDRSTVANFETVQRENGKNVKRKINFYNIDMIVIIGLKIGSNRGKLLEKFLCEYFDKQELKTIENNEIIIYDNGRVHVSVKVSKKEQTIWGSQQQIARLFETTRENINMHIGNIVKEGELELMSICKDFLHMASNGRQYVVKLYNLDMILAVGYRINTKKAIQFRRWASEVLKDVIKQGYHISNSRCIECSNSILQLHNEVEELKKHVSHQITMYPNEELITFSAIERFLKSAKSEILIVDNYFGHDFDNVLASLTVKITIITNNKNTKIDTNNIYKVVKVKEFHDRYIMVDTICYHFGQSFSELGSKYSTATVFKDEVFINLLKEMIK